MARYVTVRLTVAQAYALLAAVAYCTAAGPEDWGQSDDPEGRRKQRVLDSAGDAVAMTLMRTAGGARRAQP